MPRAHTIRRWLWRLNGAMALLVPAVVAWAVFGDWEDASSFVIRRHSESLQAAPQDASLSWAEIEEVTRPWIQRAVATSVREEPPSPPQGLLPLAALKVVCHIADGSGPDSILLKSKDPAHPETYAPVEGMPDGGIAIEEIRYEPGATKITVKRGEERFTYRVVSLEDGPRSGLVRIIPAAQPMATAGGEERACALASRAASRPVDVKLVPFYGKDGKYMGGRVTGVRPGSRLAVAGLRPGDVVLGVDDAWAPSVERLRSRLRNLDGATCVEIFRGDFDVKRRMILDG